jgi:hypothetical protein
MSTLRIAFVMCIGILGAAHISFAAPVADPIFCGSSGNVVVVLEGPEGLTGFPNSCSILGSAAPLQDVFRIDVLESNPPDPMFPVSDYFDITRLGANSFTITVVSDSEAGLTRRTVNPAADLTLVEPAEGTYTFATTATANGQAPVINGTTYFFFSDVPEPGTVVMVASTILVLLARKTITRGVKPHLP